MYLHWYVQLSVMLCGCTQFIFRGINSIFLYFILVRNCSEIITGGRLLRGAPRFRHLSEGFCPDFANLPRGDPNFAGRNLILNLHPSPPCNVFRTLTNLPKSSYMISFNWTQPLGLQTFVMPTIALNSGTMSKPHSLCSSVTACCGCTVSLSVVFYKGRLTCYFIGWCIK